MAATEEVALASGLPGPDRRSMIVLAQFRRSCQPMHGTNDHRCTRLDGSGTTPRSYLLSVRLTYLSLCDGVSGARWCAGSRMPGKGLNRDALEYILELAV